MEVKNCIEKRRSIRKYKDTPVSRETVLELIAAANNAPSWKNSQVSRYYIADGEQKKILAARHLPDFNQNNVKDAPVLIVAAVVKGISGAVRNGDQLEMVKDSFQYFDNGLQVENLCLRACDMGLGTLIMGLYDDAGIREFFNIPENEDITCVISLGYPDQEPDARPRMKAEEIAFFKD